MSEQENFNQRLLIVMKQQIDMLIKEIQEIKRHPNLIANGRMTGNAMPVQATSFTKTQQRIIEHLAGCEHSYLSNIAERTGLSLQTVDSNLQKLARLNKVEYQKQGKGKLTCVKLLQR